MPLTQALGALLLASAGFAFGLALDLYRVLRRLSNPGRLLTAICDLLFWLAYAVWIFVLLQRISAGEVRYHVFLSIAAGVSIYFWLFSHRLGRAWYTLIYRLMRAANRIADWLSRALDAVLAIALWPYRTAMHYLIRPIWRMACFLFRPLSLLLKWLQQQLARLLRWLTSPLRRLFSRLRCAIAKILTPPTKES